MAAVKKMEKISESFKTEDGLNLRLYRASVKNAKGNIVFIHGFADHSARYDYLVEELCSASFNVFQLDLRGHGRSDGPRGGIRTFDDYLTDIRGAVKMWKLEQRSEAPWTLAGHSMGGLIVCRYMEVYADDFSAAALSSPFLGLRIPVPAWKEAAAIIAAKIMPSLSLPSGIDPVVLTHDAAVVDAYRDDPLVFKTANARWFVEISKAQKEVFAQIDRVKAPMLVMQAADDMLVDPAASRRFYEKLKKPEKELKIYDHCYHELFQELNKEKIVKDLVEWIKLNSLPAAG